MELYELLNLLMFVSACGLLLLGFPVAFTLAGVAMLFAAIGIGLGEFDTRDLGALPSRIFGSMTNEVLMAVPLFVFMGVMLERSKVAEELLEAMGRLFGTMRGGLGLSVTIVGALLAASTGIVGATVVTMGLLSLPTMLRRGYAPGLAAGSIAAAGTLGQIIPPSIVLVLLGDVISTAYQQAQLEQGIFSPDPVSVGDLFAGALIPGLMLVAMYMGYQMLVAIFKPDAAPAIPKDETDTRSPNELFKAALHALVPPVVLIVSVLGSILAGIATPTEAAAVGATGSVLLAGYRLDERHPTLIYGAAMALIAILVLTGTMDLRVGRESVTGTEQLGIYFAFLCCLAFAGGVGLCLYRTYKAGILQDVMRSTAEITSMVFVILIGAGLFSLVFRSLGGDDTVEDILRSIPGGTFGAIAMVMLVMFILGFFLDFIEITFVVVPLVAPVLLQMDISPVWLGVMMAINLQTSFLTPPFGFALFYLRGVAPASVTTMAIYKGVIPFVIIQIAALGLLALFPQLAEWLPTVIFG
ncbi:MAG: TRAP transporter large permease [Alphaproteobacteria bacterium]